MEELKSKTVDLPLANPCKIAGKEYVRVSADSELNTNMRNERFASVYADFELNMDVQNGNVSNAILVVTNVESDGVSPEPQFSGKEPISVDSEFNIDVQKGKITYAISVETHVQNYTISPKLQLSGKESVLKHCQL
ncbi:hypothetical protein Tco_0266119 [Tanacetum coccineum]